MTIVYETGFFIDVKNLFSAPLIKNIVDKDIYSALVIVVLAQIDDFILQFGGEISQIFICLG